MNSPLHFSAVPSVRFERPPLLPVVMQHVEEAAHLRHVRSVLIRAPHVSLPQLGRLDQRVSAHLDGISVAGNEGRRLCRLALERAGKGEIFAAAVGAISDRDIDGLDALIGIADANPLGHVGLLSAFGWCSAKALQGITATILEAADPGRHELVLAACAMHGVDPLRVLDVGIEDPSPRLRARALQVAGRCGRLDLLAACLASLADDDALCAFEAARSAVLLGDRSAAMDALQSLAFATGPRAAAALRLLMMVNSPSQASDVLARMARVPAVTRSLIQCIGLAGDARYLPWLIEQMEDVQRMRLAGEAFSFITGLDLSSLTMDRQPPESVEFGPNDDPNDESVAMDEDDSLPWPDRAKIAAWWMSNRTRFASGSRHFIGDAPTPGKCISVLKNGFQRQRIVAATHLTLLIPGTPLFNAAAPAWRQQRLLDRMIS